MVKIVDSPPGIHMFTAGAIFLTRTTLSSCSKSVDGWLHASPSGTPSTDNINDFCHRVVHGSRNRDSKDRETSPRNAFVHNEYILPAFLGVNVSHNEIFSALAFRAQC